MLQEKLWSCFPTPDNKTKILNSPPPLRLSKIILIWLSAHVWTKQVSWITSHVGGAYNYQKVLSGNFGENPFQAVPRTFLRGKDPFIRGCRNTEILVMLKGQKRWTYHKWLSAALVKITCTNIAVWMLEIDIWYRCGHLITLAEQTRDQTNSRESSNHIHFTSYIQTTLQDTTYPGKVLRSKWHTKRKTSSLYYW